MPSCWAPTRASPRSPVLPELAEVRKMTIADELRRLGYTFQYDHGDSEERTEVWVNKKAGMAVRIEWMRVDGQVKGRDW